MEAHRISGPSKGQFRTAGRWATWTGQAARLPAVKPGPKAPIAVSVELIQDLSELSSPVEGYLRRRRYRARTVLSDGVRTEPYVVDWVERERSRRDAAAVVLYEPAASGRPSEAWVLLRRQVRWAFYQIHGESLCLELVAGLQEGSEPWTETARRETREEAGIDLPEAAFVSLGPPVIPIPASFAEQIALLAVEVPDLLQRATAAVPDGDGSPLEEGADLWVMRLDAAIELCETEPGNGPHGLFIADAKTEIGLRRLRARLDRGSAP